MLAHRILQCLIGAQGRVVDCFIRFAEAIRKTFVPREAARVNACCGAAAHAHARVYRSDEIWLLVILVVALNHFDGQKRLSNGGKESSKSDKVEI